MRARTHAYTHSPASSLSLSFLPRQLAPPLLQATEGGKGGGGCRGRPAQPLPSPPPARGARGAQDCVDGVGVVKLMGRECGFVAMHATLASNDVDICLLPEAPPPSRFLPPPSPVAARPRSRGRARTRRHVRRTGA